MIVAVISSLIALTLGTVALVSARPETARRWKDDLTPVLRDTLVMMSPDQAMKPLPAGMGAPPDVFLIEADLDGAGSGLRLMSELASRAATRPTSASRSARMRAPFARARSSTAGGARSGVPASKGGAGA